MFRHAAAFLLVVASFFTLPGCLEVEMNTKVEETGAGTCGVRFEFTKPFVQAMNDMKDIDPNYDALESAEDLKFAKASPARVAAFKAEGVELLSQESIFNATTMRSSVKVRYASPKAAAKVRGMATADEDSAFAIAPVPVIWKNADGTYTLTFAQDESGPDLEPDVEPTLPDRAEPEVPEDPAKALENAVKAMKILTVLMEEMEKFKIVASTEVPGEIVSYEPKAGAKVEGNKVVWTMDMKSMTESGMDTENPQNSMSGVRIVFRMPAGKSLPAAALSVDPNAKK